MSNHHRLAQINAEIARIEQTLLGAPMEFDAADPDHVALDRMARELWEEIMERFRHVFAEYEGVVFDIASDPKNPLEWVMRAKKPGDWSGYTVMVGTLVASLEARNNPMLQIKLLFGDVSKLREEIEALNHYGDDKEAAKWDGEHLFPTSSGKKEIRITELKGLDRKQAVRWEGVLSATISSDFVDDLRLTSFGYNSKAELYGKDLNTILFAWETEEDEDDSWRGLMVGLSSENEVQKKRETMGEKVQRWVRAEYLPTIKDDIIQGSPEVTASGLEETKERLEGFCAQITEMFKEDYTGDPSADCTLRQCKGFADKEVLEKLFSDRYIEGAYVYGNDYSEIETRLYSDASVVLFKKRGYEITYALTEMFPKPTPSGDMSHLWLRFDAFDAREQDPPPPNADLMQKLLDYHKTGSWMGLLQTYDSIVGMFSRFPNRCCCGELQFSGGGSLGYNDEYWKSILMMFCTGQVKVKQDLNGKKTTGGMIESHLRTRMYTQYQHDPNPNTWELRYIFSGRYKGRWSTFWIFRNTLPTGSNTSVRKFVIGIA